ncbi:hypothetical protein J6590_018282 [Homalodisca vitripennis]|nr:hypothetical protein J6590_018282 [Homalodisca vitripennis]
MCADHEHPVRQNKNSLWCSPGVSCKIASGELGFLSSPIFYNLDVTLHCRFKCELVQGRDVHQYKTRGRNNFRTEQHGTTMFEHLPGEVMLLRSGRNKANLALLHLSKHPNYPLVERLRALISSHIPPEEGEASYEAASPVKAQEPLILRERTPPTPTVISRSRLDLSNCPCPESRHLRLVMCHSWTPIRGPSPRGARPGLRDTSILRDHVDGRDIRTRGPPKLGMALPLVVH